MSSHANPPVTLPANGYDITSQVETLSNGDFLVTWIERTMDEFGTPGGIGGKVMGQVFHTDGSVGSSLFTVADIGANEDNSHLDTAVLKDGRIVLSWLHLTADGQGEIQASILDANGHPAADHAILDIDGPSPTLGGTPLVTALESGGFVVSYSNDTTAVDKVFNAAGSPQSTVSQTYFTADSITSLKDGGYLTEQVQFDTATNTNHIVVERHDSSGQVSDAPLTIATVKAPGGVSETTLSDGRVVFAWCDIGDTTKKGVISAAFYDPGTKGFTPFTLYTDPSHSISDPHVTADANGGFALTFTQFTTDDHYNLNWATFAADGHSIIAPTSVDIGSDNDINNSVMTENSALHLSNGNYLASWEVVDNATSPETSTIHFQIFGGENWTGTDADETHDGTDFSDTLNGAGGNDILTGGDGNDTLIGGTGADRLTGGAGSDFYVVDNPGDTVIEGNDGADTDTILTSVNYALPDHVEILIAASGKAPLTLTGNAMANTIEGNDGDNTLDGGAGADDLKGGDGNDTYIVDNAGDRITDTAGTDMVITSISYSLENAIGVENLTGTGSAPLTLNGNAAANAITGASGSDTLFGGAGDDTLNGGAGADHMDGGSGNDTYLVDNAFDSISDVSGIDMVLTSASFTLGAGLENLSGLGSAGLSLTGNAAANRITGTAGNDTLKGAGGHDTLTGGAGKDTFLLDAKIAKAHNTTIATIDFQHKQDRIWLSHTVFKGIGKGSLKKPAHLKADYFTAHKSAQDSSDHILYDPKSGKLFYDADGTGHQKPVEIADLPKHIKGIAASDFFVA